MQLNLTIVHPLVEHISLGISLDDKPVFANYFLLAFLSWKLSLWILRRIKMWVSPTSPPNFELNRSTNSGDLLLNRNHWKRRPTQRLNRILSPYRIYRWNMWFKFELDRSTNIRDLLLNRNHWKRRHTQRLNLILSPYRIYIAELCDLSLTFQFIVLQSS